jgi:hypothetical protein
MTWSRGYSSLRFLLLDVENAQFTGHDCLQNVYNDIARCVQVAPSSNRRGLGGLEIEAVT